MRMGAAGASAADVVAAASERDLANIIFLLGEERHSRAVARAIVKARGASADHDDRRARRHRRRGGARAARRHPSGHAHVSGAAHLRQRRAGRTRARACRRRAHSQIRRPAGGRVVPLARGPHRQDVSAPPRLDARRLAPCAGNQARRAELSPADQAAGDRRRRGSRAQSARPFGQAARRRAHRRAGACRRCVRFAAAPAGAWPTC